MKKLLLPLLALICCVSGANAQKAPDAATERKISALENAKNSAIKSANEQYQTDAARIQKTSLSSIERVNDELDNLKGSQTGTTGTSSRTGSSGANSASNKKTKELEKRIKGLKERQEKLLKEAHEEYLKKFNLYKKNHYVALKPLAPEKAEEFMKECTPLDPITAADSEKKK